MKGVPTQEIKGAVASMANEVGLGTKRNAWSKTLSGGQKRKLSVGIALIGGSKVRFLILLSLGFFFLSLIFSCFLSRL